MTKASALHLFMESRTEGEVSSAVLLLRPSCLATGLARAKWIAAGDKYSLPHLSEQYPYRAFTSPSNRVNEDLIKYIRNNYNHHCQIKPAHILNSSVSGV